LTGLVFLLLSCTPRSLAPPHPAISTPPASRVPFGCERNLSGDYRHAQNPSFRYRATDDGGTLTLDVERGRSDAGPDELSTTILLTRSAEGFSGATLASVHSPGGSLCAVEFRTAVLACDDAGLLLQAEAAATLDEACRAPAQRQAGTWVEQRLLRSPAPSPSMAPSPTPGSP
jgi:hypothetical protein